MIRRGYFNWLIALLVLSLLLFSCASDKVSEKISQDGDIEEKEQDIDPYEYPTVFVDGDNPLPDGDISQPDGDESTVDGDTSQTDGDDFQPDGDTSQTDGDESQVDGDDIQPDGDIDNPNPLGKKALIFYGHSGVSPSGFYGYGKHGALVEYYQKAGLTVDYTDKWPSGLSDHRLVILAVPGSGNSKDLFTISEVNMLKAFLSSGGYLYIENEKSYYSGTVVINDLLTRMGSVIRQENDTIGSGGNYGVLTTEIGNHKLTEGIDKLGFGEGSRVLPNGETILVEYNKNCVMAVENMGSGLLIVSGDQQFIDDHAFSTYPSDGGDNLIFADNLARLP